MKTSNAIPGFDALKMKAELQAKVLEKTKDMTPEEWVAYYKERSASRPPIWKRDASTLREPQRPDTKKKEIA